MAIPETIYLQIQDDDGNSLPEGATWCVDKIFDTDIEYVRVTGHNLTPAAPDETES